MVSSRRLAAIMFTDMVDYTASAQIDERGTLELVREQEGLVRPLIAIHHGREIKSTGDGFLIEFESALHAVRCAIDIQERLHDRNSEPGVAPIRLRIGVHLGDVEERGKDIFGDAVNIASRIEPLAAPGGVCISGEVYSQIRNKIPNRFDKLEKVSLKNVRTPIDLYEVSLPWEGLEPAVEGTALTRLAVLPLVNISPDPKDEYFADGLTEELIACLSKIGELRVIARTSVGQYKAASKTVAQIAAELGVTSVLEGSVRMAGNRLRITLQLIDARTQDHLWANSYDRELDDVFAIQSEIAESTARALKLELLGHERASIRKKPTSNLVAYDLYLRGLHAAHHPRPTGWMDAIRFFEEAIRADPKFALAYSSGAISYISLAGEALPPSETFPRAREWVAKAFELDPDSTNAHVARGTLAFQSDQDWKFAEDEFRRAIALNPSSTSAHFWYAMLLRTVQRFDESADELRAAIALDPLWIGPRAWLPAIYLLSGDLASATAAAEQERDKDPQDALLHVILGTIHVRAGRSEQARREANLATGSLPDTDWWNRPILRALVGELEDAQRVVREWEEGSRGRYLSPPVLAGMYAALGRKEKALELLERDVREGDRLLFWNFQWVAFDALRDDPRFRSLLKQLNLPVDLKRTVKRRGKQVRTPVSVRRE